MKESATEGLSLVAEAGLANKHRASFSRMLGDVSGQEGDYEGAMKLVEVSLTLSRKANDVNGIVHSLLLLGIRYEVLGGLEDLERARELFDGRPNVLAGVG